MRTGRTMGTMDPAFAARVPVVNPNGGANMRGLTIIPDAAFLLQRTREIECDGDVVTVVSAYTDRQLTKTVLPSALAALSADNECAHGGLPVDPHPQPGCTPDCPGYPTLPMPEPEEAISVSAITEAHHGSAASNAADPDAPYGHKPDGTPRKKPAPTPEHIAAIQRGHAERKAARLAAQAATAVAEAPPAPDPAAEAEQPEPFAPEPIEPIIAPAEATDVGFTTPLIARFLDEIDERARQLIERRSVLLAEIAQLEAEADELGATRERLVGA